MKHQDLIKEADQKSLYLIHHMHHYPDNQEVIHELHHCYLFSQPNMEGEKYSVDHLFKEGQLYHVLNRKSPDLVFDHANNKFNIQEKKLAGKIYHVLNL